MLLVVTIQICYVQIFQEGLSQPTRVMETNGLSPPAHAAHVFHSSMQDSSLNPLFCL